MGVKSNIDILSNIYIKSDTLKNDTNFVENVRGPKALKKLRNRLAGTLVKAKLNDVQLEEIDKGASCSRAKNNEITHGKIIKDGKLRWEGRCEYSECLQYEACGGSRAGSGLIRGDTEELYKIEEINIEKYPYLESEGFQKVMSDYGDTYEDDREPIEELKFENPSNNLKVIEQPDEIISSTIGSKIFVDAGAGTGKTYTVLQRLLHIMGNNLIDAKNILVLCYSRSTKEIIDKGIQEAIKNGILLTTSELPNVSTFESFATQVLIEEGEEDLENLNFNKRVKRFNEKVSEEMLISFEYLIVDGLQNLVNERAWMVINIIEHINCGYLLLGDKYQAISDYDHKTSMKSSEFYKILKEMMGDNVLNYKLIKNNRQQEKIAILTDQIRRILIKDEIENQNTNTLAMLSAFDSLDEKAEFFIPIVEEGKKSAILCRTDVEAELISERFYSEGIKHTLVRDGDYTVKLDRWLADILWDYCNDCIHKNDFVDRVTIRLGYSLDKTEQLFDILNRFTDSAENIIEIGKLVDLISKGIDLPQEVTTEEFSGISVSTVHRAKDNEFDNVYLIENDCYTSEKDVKESKVRYVATTRSKGELKFVEKDEYNNWNLEVLKSGRSSRFTKKLRRGKEYNHCSNIALGLDGDVDPISFVSKELFNELDIIKKQQYISENIMKNDKLIIKFHSKKQRYLIYHKNKTIGALAKEIDEEFWEIVGESSCDVSIPNRLTDIYVRDVVTIANTRVEENIPRRFRESNLWLGIEIAGLSRINL